MLNDKLIPADDLLPAPSILAKIVALRPESGDEIFKSFENIAQQRRAHDLKAQPRLNLFQAFTRAVTGTLLSRPWQDMLDSYQHARSANLPASPQAAINRDWAVIGDDLRAAFNDHITAHNLGDRLALTEKERQSLQYVARNFTPGHTRPAVLFS